MIIAYKSWLEIRRRLLTAIGVWLFLLLTVVVISAHEHKYTQDAFRSVTAIEAVMLLVFGAMLAGTGVVTQSCTGSAARMPDSVLFTLSLPVSRRRLLLSRAAAGALVLAPVIVLFWAILPIFRAVLPGWPALRGLGGALPFQAVAAVLGYTAALLGLSLFSETVFAYVLGFVGAIAGVGTGFLWPPLTDFLDFASGAAYLRTGQVSWTGIAVCLALSCVFVAFAVRTIERREF